MVSKNLKLWFEVTKTGPKRENLFDHVVLVFFRDLKDRKPQKSSIFYTNKAWSECLIMHNFSKNKYLHDKIHHKETPVNSWYWVSTPTLEEFSKQEQDLANSFSKRKWSLATILPKRGLNTYFYSWFEMKIRNLKCIKRS